MTSAYRIKNRKDNEYKNERRKSEPEKAKEKGKENELTGNVLCNPFSLM